MNERQINLHIDRLVLHGFPQMKRERLQQAIQNELKRLITTQGLASSLNRTAQIKQTQARSIKTHKRMPERTLGRRIASSVYKGVLR